MTQDLSEQQRNFTLDVFRDMPARKAYMAHYNVTDVAVADANASRLLSNAKVQAYLAELREAAVTPKIATVIERKERLSQFIREDLPGKYGGKSRGPAIASVAELNKMEGAYAPIRHQINQRIVFDIEYSEPRPSTEEEPAGEESIEGEYREIGSPEKGQEDT